MRRQFGPAYSEALDGKRIAAQQEAIRLYMLRREWATLQEIAQDLGFPESSVSAQLRHLRKPEFGGYRVDKRRRGSTGCWEYHVEPFVPAFDAAGQGLLFHQGGHHA
jgi:predicted transcriptional regulator